MIAEKLINPLILLVKINGAEGVGFERGQGIFSKSITPQLPPHHQRRTAS
jgi:hypothetical protein